MTTKKFSVLAEVYGVWVLVDSGLSYEDAQAAMREAAIASHGGNYVIVMDKWASNYEGQDANELPYDRVGKVWRTTSGGEDAFVRIARDGEKVEAAINRFYPDRDGVVFWASTAMRLLERIELSPYRAESSEGQFDIGLLKELANRLSDDPEFWLVAMANRQATQPDVRNSAAWHAWRCANSKVRPNLYEADLYGADLTGTNLSGADLRKADLRGANLYGVNLSGADLRKADLRGANLPKADLSGADLHEVKGILDLGHDTRGFQWMVVLPAENDGPAMIKAGCWWFTIDEARAHWGSEEYASDHAPSVVVESRARLALAEILVAQKG